MSEQTWEVLVNQVRRLADEIAPVDPDAASAAFDVLVATYGRNLAGAALLAVAPTEVPRPVAQQDWFPGDVPGIPYPRA
ncbi:hypothetical protein DFQ14_1136 [Halopolyspora algeriensis]|uniref:Uncharacterized protein n=1 Tax=Halopolyspora algeriensis TaxID=1500506 RepID=A0A368VLM8_9ACTN|nr:hypothetical protein [Halopolyspora algeriensis]RCW39925.1 hypothetical protein DFQ14_1136 [Halopolyspora algeriensis]TQM46638.1 hypothetical protein FHU43_3756 [Halopolyspora algeriensis]